MFRATLSTRDIVCKYVPAIDDPIKNQVAGISLKHAQLIPKTKSARTVFFRQSNTARAPILSTAVPPCRFGYNINLQLVLKLGYLHLKDYGPSWPS